MLLVCLTAAIAAEDSPPMSYSSIRKQQEQQAAKDRSDSTAPDAGVQLATARQVSNMDKVLGFLNRVGNAATTKNTEPEEGRKLSNRVSQIGEFDLSI